MKEQMPDVLIKIVSDLQAAGGRVMLVGGSVVDLVRGVDTPVDWDLEVYGKDYDELALILKDYGAKTCGKNFGIIKLSSAKCDGLSVDVSVPRRENNIGVGHTDFDVYLDPTMTPREAAMRRDFTFNSLYWDFEQGYVIDHFGGLKDLDQGLLKATNPESFVEDALRVARAGQFLAREKASQVDISTMTLMRSMIEDFTHLSKERVFEEFKKLLMKGKRPSVGLNFFDAVGLLRLFPELEVLKGCEQNPDWHPEGDVWTHTKCISDSAAWARDKVDPDWQEAFVFGCMLHDVGKPETTVTPEMMEKRDPRVAKLSEKTGKAPEDLLWTAYGHDRAGIAPATAFMKRLTNDKKLIERVGLIVGEHMQPFQLHQGGAKESAWKKLHNKVRLDVMGWVSRCDSCGNFHRTVGDPDLDHDVSVTAWNHYDDLGGPEPVKQILQGRHLIAAGYKPGPDFGKALKVAYEAQIEDANLGEDELLKVATDFIQGQA
jgi:tRNA nucleotidyltransferase (CCA-adding enzyme)